MFSFFYLSFGLGCEVLLEFVVCLLGSVVSGKKEGDGVPYEALVMERGGAGLAHGPQQTRVSVSSGEVGHGALEAGVESRPRTLTPDWSKVGLGEGPPRAGGDGGLAGLGIGEAEGDRDVDGGVEVGEGDGGVKGHSGGQGVHYFIIENPP